MKYRIGIIEDELSIAQMYAFKLEREGYEVKSVANGLKGIELVKNWKPHLILLDLMMPEMSGEEMLEKVRGTDTGSNLKVIVLTNISKTEAPTKLRFLNVDRYIIKAHYTPSQVVKLVSEVIDQKD